MSWYTEIKATKVFRPDEGQQLLSTDHPSGGTVTTFDTGKATGLDVVKGKRQIDTTQTDGGSVPYDLTGA